MMPNPEAKAVLLLAASDLSATEIRSFLKSVDRTGVAELVRRIDALRGLAGGNSVPIPDVKSGSDADRLKEYDIVIRQVENLLVIGAGLSKADATQLLYSELVREHGQRSYIPSPNKIAFRLWLARLLDQIDPSEVMHVASRIRNELVHGKKSVSAWPLIRRENDDQF